MPKELMERYKAVPHAPSNSQIMDLFASYFGQDEPSVGAKVHTGDELYTVLKEAFVGPVVQSKYFSSLWAREVGNNEAGKETTLFPDITRVWNEIFKVFAQGQDAEKALSFEQVLTGVGAFKEGEGDRFRFSAIATSLGKTDLNSEEAQGLFGSRISNILNLKIQLFLGNTAICNMNLKRNSEVEEAIINNPKLKEMETKIFFKVLNAPSVDEATFLQFFLAGEKETQMTSIINATANDQLIKFATGLATRCGADDESTKHMLEIASEVSKEDCTK